MNDRRFVLTEEEKSELSEAMNEFGRYHKIPVMSPVWASRIGLGVSLATIVSARADIVLNPDGTPDKPRVAPNEGGIAPSPRAETEGFSNISDEPAGGAAGDQPDNWYGQPGATH